MNRKLLKGLEGILFIFASLCFFYFFYILVCDINGFKHLYRIIPMVLTLILPVYLLFIVHLLLYPINYKKYRSTLIVNGYILGYLSLILVILIPTYVGLDIYHGFVQGVITPLFPLDFFILALLLLALSIYFLIKGYKLQESDKITYYPYSHSKTRKVFDSIFRSFYAIIALYLTGALILGITSMINYGGNHQANVLPLYFLIVVQDIILAYYEYFYKENKDKAKQHKIVTLSILGTTAILSTALLIVFINDPYVLVYECTAFFPADFMGSLNLAPYLVSFPPLIASIWALIPMLKKKQVA
jgi:hypothetical protein